MGKLEKESRKRSKKANIKKVILQTVAGVGLVSAALIAPNVVSAMIKLGLIPTGRINANRSRDRLVQNGLLQYEGKYLRLTVKGEKELRRLELSDFAMKKPKKWDRKWRVLIFDIPERKRGLRQKVRQTLIAIGFIKLQNSVWIYPYDCEDLINLLKADFGIGKDLLYLIVDSLEYDDKLKKDFGLS